MDIINDIFKLIDLNVKCVYCENFFYLFSDCKKFIGINIQERYSFMKSKGLCYGCLKKGYMSMKCRNRLKCLLCGCFYFIIFYDLMKFLVNVLNYKSEVGDFLFVVLKIKQFVVNCFVENLSISVCCDIGVGD